MRKWVKTVNAHHRLAGSLPQFRIVLCFCVSAGSLAEEPASFGDIAAQGFVPKTLLGQKDYLPFQQGLQRDPALDVGRGRATASFRGAARFVWGCNEAISTDVHWKPGQVRQRCWLLRRTPRLNRGDINDNCLIANMI